MAAVEAQRQKRPLLVVIDQFEEFLILNEGAARAPLSELLQALGESPLPGLRLLCVYRADCGPLIFDLGLPEPRANVTLCELLPFRREAAEDFFRRGGFVLTTEAFDGLFRSLDRLEGTPGLYRPITLNMIGLVLQRMGRQVTEDPERLIERYLRQCLTEGDARDYAAAVLKPLITGAGTKEPRDIAEVVTTTRFSEPRVRHTLFKLEGDGLVRRLDNDGVRWEVSHDFLARMLGQIIGKLRPDWIRQSAPAVGVAALALFSGLSLWLAWLGPQLREKEAIEALLDAGVRIASTADGPVIRLEEDERDDDAKLVVLGRYWRPLPPAKVRALDLTRSSATSLEPLRGMPMTSLDLSSASGVTSLEPLRGMPMTNLDLSFASSVASLEPLRGMPLTNLNLSFASSVASLEPLRGMPLTNLQLRDAHGLTSLEPLRGMPLTTLYLSGATGVTNLEPLRGMPLAQLDLSGASGVTNLEPLRGMPLAQLGLQGASGVTSLEPLRGMPLTTLYLSGASGVTSLEPLRGMQMANLALRHASGVTSLEPLRDMPLTNLSLSGANSIVSVEPLRGKALANFPFFDPRYNDWKEIELLKLGSLEPLDGLQADPSAEVFIRENAGQYPLLSTRRNPCKCVEGGVTPRPKWCSAVVIPDAPPAACPNGPPPVVPAPAH